MAAQERLQPAPHSSKSIESILPAISSVSIPVAFPSIRTTTIVEDATLLEKPQATPLIRTDEEINSMISQQQGMLGALAGRYRGVQPPDPAFDEEDLKQEALIAVWQAIKTYDSTKGPFRSYAAAWADRSMRNRISNQEKHMRRARRHHLVYAKRHRQRVASEVEEQVLQKIDSEQVQEQIAGILVRLPKTERQLLVDYFGLNNGEKLTYEQIGDALNCSGEMVRLRVQGILQGARTGKTLGKEQIPTKKKLIKKPDDTIEGRKRPELQQTEIDVIKRLSQGEEYENIANSFSWSKSYKNKFRTRLFKKFRVGQFTLAKGHYTSGLWMVLKGIRFHYIDTKEVLQFVNQSAIENLSSSDRKFLDRFIWESGRSSYNQQLAKAFNVSERTIEEKLGKIQKQVGAKTKIQLAAVWKSYQKEIAKHELSELETSIFRLLAKGYSYREISKELNYAYDSITWTANQANKKLNITGKKGAHNGQVSISELLKRGILVTEDILSNEEIEKISELSLQERLLLKSMMTMTGSKQDRANLVGVGKYKYYQMYSALRSKLGIKNENHAVAFYFRSEEQSDDVEELPPKIDIFPGEQVLMQEHEVYPAENIA